MSSTNYRAIAFTPKVRAIQADQGSRDKYARFEGGEIGPAALTAQESEFIAARDSFYQATVSETGWPYVQHRGGPAGFLKVLDERTIGYADYLGNAQYISTGNLQGDDRISIILMDYAEQRRLKLFGRVRFMHASDAPEVAERLAPPNDYQARIERLVLITVEASEWNCPQHITPRYTEAEVQAMIAPLHRRLQELERSAPSNHQRPLVLGSGQVRLRVVGIRELTPRVRSYLLESADGLPLPPVEPGAHLQIPVRVEGGREEVRHYSISAAAKNDYTYEIAVLGVQDGGGGSLAVHRDLVLGTQLRCPLPENRFVMNRDEGQPVVLIAGGIGITPLRFMAQQVARQPRPLQMHYAARSAAEAAYLGSLTRLLGDRLKTYFGDSGERLDPVAVLGAAPPEADFYVCGPDRLIDATLQAAADLGIARGRVRYERFAGSLARHGTGPVKLVLQRSGKTVDVPAEVGLLDAVEMAGVNVPSSCRNGICATCAVKVLAGEAEHLDSVLTESERNDDRLMCLCISGARTPELVLDL